MCRQQAARLLLPFAKNLHAVATSQIYKIYETKLFKQNG
jgi:hypothetical protein